MEDDLSYGLNTLGPLCLWQCFIFREYWLTRIYIVTMDLVGFLMVVDSCWRVALDNSSFGC